MDKVICTCKLASGRTLPIDRYLSPITLSNLITLLFLFWWRRWCRQILQKSCRVFLFFCKPRLLITSEIKSFKMFLKPKLFSVETLLCSTIFIYLANTMRFVDVSLTRRHSCRPPPPSRSFAESLSLYIILIYPNVALRVFTGTACLIMAITIKCDSNTPWMVYQMKFIWSRTLLDLGSSDNKSHFHVGGVSQCSERLRKTSKKGFVRFMRRVRLFLLSLSVNIDLLAQINYTETARNFLHETHFVHHRFC